jgi:hypothetical protein
MNTAKRCALILSVLMLASCSSAVVSEDTSEHAKARSRVEALLRDVNASVQPLGARLKSSEGHFQECDDEPGFLAEYVISAEWEIAASIEVKRLEATLVQDGWKVLDEPDSEPPFSLTFERRADFNAMLLDGRSLAADLSNSVCVSVPAEMIG